MLENYEFAMDRVIPYQASGLYELVQYWCEITDMLENHEFARDSRELSLPTRLRSHQFPPAIGSSRLHSRWVASRIPYRSRRPNDQVGGIRNICGAQACSALGA